MFDMLIIIEFMFFYGRPETAWYKRVAIISVLCLTIPVIPSTNLLLKGYSQSDPSVSFKAGTSMDRFQYFYTELNVVVTYIKLLIIPDRQNFDYGNDYPVSHTIWENHSYVSLIILSVIGAAGILNVRRNKLFSLGVLWFFTTISVESSFISIKDVYFEHRLYLPTAGFLMAVAGLVLGEYKIPRLNSGSRKPVFFFSLLFALMTFFYTGLTLRRNYIYSDEIRLWSDVVAKAPGSDRAHGVLGANYMDRYREGDKNTERYLELAEKELAESIRLNYGNDVSHCNLARVYLMENKPDQCIREAYTAIRLNPSVYAYNNMGSAYLKIGQTDMALSAFESGLKLDGRNTFILKNIGDLYYEIKDYEKARYYYEEYRKNDIFKTGEVYKRLAALGNGH